MQGFSKHGDRQLRAQRINIWLWFAADSQMLLKDILVDKSERTEDILSQISDKERAEYAEKSAKGPVRALVNANNRGYCRVLMSLDELRFFGGVLEKLDLVNRCYLWRILFDHVKTGVLNIEDFW